MGKKDCSCKRVLVKDENCKTHGGHGDHHCCCCHHHHWCHCPPRYNPYWSGPYYTSGGVTYTSGSPYQTFNSTNTNSSGWVIGENDCEGDDDG